MVKKAVSFATFNNKDNYTDTGFEPGKGRARADALIASGAKVIFPVAGPQIQDVFASAEAAGKNDIRVIGVDTDMANRYDKQKDWFITSVLKNIKDSVSGLYKVITNSPDADKETFKGLGQITRGNFANKLTQLADNTTLGAWSKVSDPGSFYKKVVEDKALITKAEDLTKGKTWDDAYNELIKLDNNDIRA
ncbi:BMP family ABC transporter substrate-binding protein [Mycoplasma sp. ATU-Cv-508]|uniref:BMP family ABC transporter substrate-binding protein n=1 Tax=Mycoplasma sp. ATU-Cv-508 TaxID=2048001 RepID=UPI001374C66A